MSRKYTITEMRNLNQAKGHHFFSKSTMKVWSGIIHSTYVNGLFIDSVDNYDRTKRVYMVRIFTTDHDVCTLEQFPSLNMAKDYVKTLNKALKNNLGNREKETLNNVTYVRCNKNNENEYLEFFNDNDNGVSHSFTLNMDLQVVG